MPMKFILQPWHLMLILLASWINCEQQQRIDYLETQCDVLREHVLETLLLNFETDGQWRVNS